MMLLCLMWPIVCAGAIMCRAWSSSCRARSPRRSSFWMVVVRYLSTGSQGRGHLCGRTKSLPHARSRVMNACALSRGGSFSETPWRRPRAPSSCTMGRRRRLRERGSRLGRMRRASRRGCANASASPPTLLPKVAPRTLPSLPMQPDAAGSAARPAWSPGVAARPARFAARPRHIRRRHSEPLPAARRCALPPLLQ